jgi:hypothetical protein
MLLFYCFFKRDAGFLLMQRKKYKEMFSVSSGMVAISRNLRRPIQPQQNIFYLNPDSKSV